MNDNEERDDDAAPELESRPQSRREWNGWLKSIVLPLGLVVVIVAGLLYIQSNRGGSSSSNDGFGTVALPAAKNATDKSPAAQQDRAAPDFLLPVIDGSQVRLSDLQGHPVLVNFWASWCTPCREEAPDLIKISNDYKDQGLQVLGVDLRESDTAVRGFVDEFGVPYPIALDRNGQVASTWRIGGPNEGVPTSYFIDSSGVVRKVVFGYLTKSLEEDGFKAILPASAASR
ncbi:MAG TPA: TlpA disulfide reductase family protein [Dehalococcoidia bacterium]|nr:TlpA disulfide reductase family protein [Dehalococcoidia bacterium]